MTDRERDLLGIDELTYGADGLIPAVVQQHDTGEVLMVAYMNRESLTETIQTGFTWFWSRSRKKFWMKGESSGHTQEVIEIRYDCDADCLLVFVNQKGPGACHTNEWSCFYRSLYPDAGRIDARKVASDRSAEGDPADA
jgi:phosphoribosyl-AMP cyclohydrolase